MTWRQRRLSKPLYERMAAVMPRMSATEREAIEAGDTWWDAVLFSGRPHWATLLSLPSAQLSAEERAFLEGPVNHLCAMLDDWDVQWRRRDLPEAVWRFLREHRFFGMIIPKAYGGLGFSAYAHSEVVRRVSSRSGPTAVTVMVPNSLGPGELLMLFGTEAQRDDWLPRLADGRAIPCFGLTSETAGSDAAGMTDTAVVCREHRDGRDTLGLRLNFRKRYITLGPVASVLGVAVRLSDPQGLLGGASERGITLVLVPADTPGVRTGARHLPAMQMFQNGPIEGKDVFVPMDAVIGGEEHIGDGWRMLMTALAAGRGISLPSLSAAAGAYTAHVSGAYARIREQFGLPIGRFEGVQEKLGMLAARAYMLDAARRMTCAAIDAGHRPSVMSAIMKYHATEHMRASVNDAMDIHGGKAVIDGPANYLGVLYRAVPVGITVEGANILTRNLIIFGQGAIRCHPFLRDEMAALADPDKARGLRRFDSVFWRHALHTAGNALRAIGHAWTGGVFAPAPALADVRPYFREIARRSAAFAVIADACLAALGGALKRKEMLSARLGDMLSELYLASAVLKRWHDEGRHHEDVPLAAMAVTACMARFDAALDGVLANLPARPLAWTLRVMLMPWGPQRGPSDALVRRCSQILLAPSASRDRLVSGLYHPSHGPGLAELERAFAAVIAAEGAQARLREARQEDVEAALASGVVTAQEAGLLRAAHAAVAAAVRVDVFAPGELAGAASDDQDGKNT
ncbi:acyl-CoA dehydrogenase [Verticiella sediminum]|nr:acyl-CoA dehydrogenase [Verticiella sediminum]